MSNFYQDREQDDPWEAYAASVGPGRWAEWQYDEPRTATTLVHKESRSHTGLGIASFVLSCVAGVGMLISIAAAAALTAVQPAIAEDDPRMIAAGLGILGCLALAGLAGVLGFAGLFRTERNRFFAVLGLATSGLLILGTGGLLIIGLFLG